MSFLKIEGHIQCIDNFINAVNTAVNSAFAALLLTTDPAEDTIMLAAAEFSGPGQGITLARKANRAKSAEDADQAADLSAFSENVVVAMEEFG